MQNKANFRKSQVNVTKVLTTDYDQMDTWSIRKNKAKQSQFKANSNPIKANKMPKQTQFYNLVCLQSPICPGNLIIKRMNRICCVCSFSVSFDSAKMALYTGGWNLNKDGRKKLNLLKCKGLNNLSRLRQLTGTLFAHLNRWNFIYNDRTQ
ncbi:MAG: hypothetical protein OEW48_17560 [Phycisphaerae bacterium]|nr:hypothetical protein [Phycisphaerae bacterium]